MAQGYRYVGPSELGYPGYVDARTDRMLIPVPGEAHVIRAVDSGDAVPPPDGRWLPDPVDVGDPTGAPPAAEPRPAAPAAADDTTDPEPEDAP